MNVNIFFDHETTVVNWLTVMNFNLAGTEDINSISVTTIHHSITGRGIGYRLSFHDDRKYDAGLFAVRFG